MLIESEDMDALADNAAICNQDDIIPAQRKIPKLNLTEPQKNALKGAIMFSSTIDEADENVTSFLSIVDKQLLPENNESDYETFRHKYLFVGQLFMVRKYAACDPPGSTQLEKITRTYRGLLQVVIDMKWR